MSAAAQPKPRGVYLSAIACPHCKAAARVRSSRELSSLVREIYLRCTNDDCGHVFGGEIAITRTISPSACPDPSVFLPLTAPRRRVAPVAAGAPNALTDNSPPAQAAAGGSPQENARTGGGPEVPPARAANDDDGLAEAVSIGS
jgi:hypothetical protein